MSAMNPINEIFLKTVQLHNAKWYQIIKRLKLVKEVNDIQYYLLYTKDIFSFSDEFFTAYCGLSHITRGKYYDQLLIYEDAPLMRIRISEKCTVKYVPSRKEFTIIDSNYGTYNVSKKTGLTGSVRCNKWKDIQDELKTFYIKTIVDTAWELAENSKG